jgi:hypothetical protein
MLVQLRRFCARMHLYLNHLTFGPKVIGYASDCKGIARLMKDALLPQEQLNHWHNHIRSLNGQL